MSVGSVTKLPSELPTGKSDGRRPHMPENVLPENPLAENPPPENPPPGNVARAELVTPSDEPARRECLRCYLVRMIRTYGCDNTRKWTLVWQQRRAPRQGQLIEDLEERGGICCDCEIIFNAWQSEDDQDGECNWHENDDFGRPYACAGAVPGSPLAPCARWRGWSISEPGDPFDDDDDYDLCGGEEPW
jgi:hypothetical protein